jgi:nucleotide-binding universal stress UspA family protein
VPGSIICGLDASESAKRAARVARELSADLGLRLVFVHVVDSESSESEVSPVVERLHHLADGSSRVNDGASWVVDAGQVADRLLDTAAKENASLIVVGSEGQRPTRLGRTSANLSRHAPCPVVIVPPGADADGRDGEQGNHDGSNFAGGIVRLGLGIPEEGREPDFDGGIVRLGLGTPEERRKPDFDGGIVRFNLGSGRP